MRQSLTRVRLVDVDRALLLRSTDPLYDFVKLAWPVVEPSPFVDNWHLPLVCEHLQAVSACELTRLIINVPPGTTKSLLTGVFWLIWEWLSRPKTKFLYASYDGSLTRRDGLKALNLLQSHWFLERWPHIRLTETKPSAGNFENTAHGFRFSTSVEGKATGRHSDIQVADDPIKPKDVSGSSSITRARIRGCSAWWRETMASRAANPSTFRRVIVMQRLHEDDLAGEMLREGGWHHLCLPMRYTGPRHFFVGSDLRTEPGQLLWPERFPETVVSYLEQREMGPAVAAAQLQQDPTPATGGIFLKSWFCYWHTKPNVPTPQDTEFPCRDSVCRVLPTGGYCEQSWDLTFKGSDGTDFVAGGVWLRHEADFYLMDRLVNARLSFTETLQAIRDMTQCYPVALTKAIEDKANGPAVEDTLRREIPGIVLVNPQGGKESRAHACTGLFQAGNVYIPHPELAPWCHDYRVQLATFPRGVNDDLVDMTTQALIRLNLGQAGRFVDAMKRIGAIVPESPSPLHRQGTNQTDILRPFQRRL